MNRTSALSSLLLGACLLPVLPAAELEVNPGVLATYTRMLTDQPAERDRALESLKQQPQVLEAVLGAFQARLTQGLERYRSGGEAKGKAAGVERVKAAKAAHAAQKKGIGEAFAKADTLPEFRKLVELHETYWNELLAFFQSESPEEKELRKLETVAGLLLQAAGKPAGGASAVQKAVAEALTPEQAAFIAGERKYLDECRRVYLWNEQHTPFAQAYQRHALKVHNEYRLIHGALPAELDEKLLDAATKHCEEMAKLKYFAHESPVAENKTWDKRIKNAGYSGSPGSENLATAGRATPGREWATQSFIMWFWDPHHYPLTNPKFRQLAVGFGPGLAGGSYGVPSAMHSEKLDPTGFPLSGIQIDHALYKKVFTERQTAGKR